MEEPKLKQPARKARTLQEKSGVDECSEKEQMLWKGMSGRSWSALVQQTECEVPEVESLQLQTSIAAVMREVESQLGGCTRRSPQAWARRTRCCQRRQ